MDDRLDRLVQRCVDGASQNAELYVLSSGELAYVALAANRYELIDDPVYAWHQLKRDWQLAVCERRGWPLEWASHRRSVNDNIKALNHVFGPSAYNKNNRL